MCEGRCLQSTEDCGCDDGQGGGGVITAINGTAPIAVSTTLGVATVSHNNAGTPGTYAYPVSITTNATGHVTAITGGSAPTIAEWASTALGTYFGFNSSAPYLETGVGYNVGISGTGDTVVGNSSTTGVASNGSVVVGRASSAASTGDVVVGTTSQAIGASGGPRVFVGQTVVFTDSVEAVCVGYLGSGSGNDYFTGIGSRISCTANKVRSTVVGSTNTMQYDRAVMIGYGNGNTGTDATSVGYQAAAAQDSAALGSGATAGNTNSVALGKGATTTTNNELCTGTQTQLRFPSLAKVAASTASTPTTFDMLWDSAAGVTKPNTMPTTGIISYTPTLGGGSTIGNGTISGRYVRSGNHISCAVIFTTGSTTSMTSNPTFSLPKTANSGVPWYGVGELDPNGTLDMVPLIVTNVTTGVVQLYYYNNTAHAYDTYLDIGDGTFTFGTGDIIKFSITYQTSVA